MASCRSAWAPTSRPSAERGAGCSYSVKNMLEEDPQAYSDKDSLLESLLLMYQSLVDSNDAIIANGRLLDSIRQVGTHHRARVRIRGCRVLGMRVAY